MTILENVPLAGLTAFRIGGPARFFAVAESDGDLAVAFAFARERELPVFILGGGSNVLVGDRGFGGLVVRIAFSGIAIEREDPAGALVRAGAGENWDDFVRWTVERGLGGLENLSLIPGTVGAAPVQNIGAYGAEVAGLIREVRVFDAADGGFKKLGPADCGFSYRDSRFKREPGRYVIVSVLFGLKKNCATDISYRDLQDHFQNKGHGDRARSVAEVREAVIAIRTAKLPDIRTVGTAGSFFKNPILSKAAFDALSKRYPGLPGFPEPDGRVKIPIAWIIDRVCGLKGKRWGAPGRPAQAGIHDTQALVIVNHGGANAADIEAAANAVEQAVREKIGIAIEREVVMVA